MTRTFSLFLGDKHTRPHWKDRSVTPPGLTNFITAFSTKSNVFQIFKVSVSKVYIEEHHTLKTGLI